MSTHRYLRLCLGLVGLGLAALSLLVYLVDPFQIYRLQAHCIPPIDRTTQVYANAGIARSYAYDSAIVGTSVCENFRPSLMDERLGGRFIKLCTQAGTVHNHALLLELAFGTRPMRHVVYGLDVYSLVGAPDATGSPVPLSLYNANPLDDASYFLNRSVLFSFLPRCLATWGQRQTDDLRDAMYCWAGQDAYGEVALYNAIFTPQAPMRPADAFLEEAGINLARNVVPFVRDHPETQFTFFFPPYSAAEWATMGSRGTLEALLALRALCYDTLCAYENVAFYDFATEDWVLHLSNYKDTTHYGQWINDAIVERLATDRPCTREALEASTQTLRAWAEAQLQAGGWVF